jgi:hypothetical protein
LILLVGVTIVVVFVVIVILTSLLIFFLICVNSLYSTSVNTTVCTIAAANLVSIISAGTCLINADENGNANYVAAATVSQSVG